MMRVCALSRKKLKAENRLGRCCAPRIEVLLDGASEGANPDGTRTTVYETDYARDDTHVYFTP